MPDIVIKELKEQLVAAQAHNKILRDALRTLSNHYPDAETLAECERVRDMVDTALAKPTDDTALRSALAAERKRYEDAVSEMVGCGTGWNECVDAVIDTIRALGGQ